MKSTKKVVSAKVTTLYLEFNVDNDGVLRDYKMDLMPKYLSPRSYLVEIKVPLGKTTRIGKIDFTK